MAGIAGSLEITHSGITNYQTIDTMGRIVNIERVGYLIPGLPVCLLPPQKLMKDEDDEWYRINDKRAELQFKDRKIVKTPINLKSNLPYIFLFQNVDESLEAINTSLYNCISKETNQNLTPTQREALRFHWRLGHISLSVIRWLSHR